MNFFSSFMARPEPRRGVQGPDTFQRHLQAYPSSFVERGHEKLDCSGRVMLPVSCLQEIQTLNLVYPLQFELKTEMGKTCYAGVLEFDAPPGFVLLPLWMFQTLMIAEGDSVRIQSVALPRVHHITLRPQQKRFIMLTNPKSVLERYLSSYPVLQQGTSICIPWVNETFFLDVISVKNHRGEEIRAGSTASHDGSPISINTEFERPLDMPPSPEAKPLPVEGVNVIGGLDLGAPLFRPPTLVPAEAPQPPAENSKQDKFTPFAGTGRTLRNAEPTASVPRSENKSMQSPSTQPFAGQGRTLR
jgi:hypothetical protein